MVVVGQRNIAVLDVDVAGHVDKRRLRRGDDAQGVADRAPVAHDHPVKQIGRARLVAFEDRLGQLIEGLVFAKRVSVAEHLRLSP